MPSVKRLIYGLPIMKAYRDLRTTQLAQRHRYHPYGFQFAGSNTFFKDDWEMHERIVIRDQLQIASVFIDVGANQGIYSCLAASMGVRVAAIEPEVGNIRFLASNIIANAFDKVEVFPIAVSNKVGFSSIFGDGDTASLISHWCDTPLGFATTVPTNTLDNLFASRWRDERIFIKMDIEGAEFDVIQGSHQLLARTNRPNWIIECFLLNKDTGNTVNRHFAPLFRIMFSYGYKCSRVGVGGDVTIETVNKWVSNPADCDLGSSNYLFVSQI